MKNLIKEYDSRYKNPIERGNKISKSKMGHLVSEETRKKISIANKGKKLTIQRRKEISKMLRGNKSNLGRKLDEKHKLNISMGVKKAYNEGRIKYKSREIKDETRKKLSLISKNSHKDKEKWEKIYKRISIAEKGKYVSEETKEKIRIARAKQILPVKDTSIEVKIQNLLKKLKIEFCTHQYMEKINHAYQCDIFIPVQDRIPQKTVIECDGDYWHNHPKGRNIDIIRTRELKEAGFRVIRLWENKIRKMRIEELNEELLINK